MKLKIFMSLTILLSVFLNQKCYSGLCCGKETKDENNRSENKKLLKSPSHKKQKYGENSINSPPPRSSKKKKKNSPLLVDQTPIKSPLNLNDTYREISSNEGKTDQSFLTQSFLISSQEKENPINRSFSSEIAKKENIENLGLELDLPSTIVVKHHKNEHTTLISTELMLPCVSSIHIYANIDETTTLNRKAKKLHGHKPAQLKNKDTEEETKEKWLETCEKAYSSMKDKNKDDTEPFIKSIQTIINKLLEVQKINAITVSTISNKRGKFEILFNSKPCIFIDVPEKEEQK